MCMYFLAPIPAHMHNMYYNMACLLALIPIEPLWYIYQLCNAFSWYTMEYPTSHLYFLRIHASLNAKEIQATSGMFYGIPRESLA